MSATEADSATRRSFSRSLSEAKFFYTDHELNDVFCKGLSEFWGNNEGLFFDVELIPSDGSARKAHRLVLSCVSPYFKSVFSPLHNGESKTKVELQEINACTLDQILQYAYTSKIEITGNTVQDLIVAASYLQLSSLVNVCTQFISENIDESNFIDVIAFADNTGLLGLYKACNDYIGQNLSKILISSSWPKLTVSQVESILKDDCIRIFGSSGAVPPPSIQEKILFDALLRYVQESKLIEPAFMTETLTKLMSNVRLHLIWKYELDSIKTAVENCQNTDITDICKALLSPFIEKQPGTLNEFEALQMPLPRNFPVMKPYKTSPLAHGYVGNYKGTFTDRLEGVPRYLKGMRIWIRRWDGRPVFGAIEVTYSDGEKVFHGERSNHEVYEFMLEPDEFIVKVIAFSGYMIDNLEFITDKGRSYGPYGGDGGGRSVLEPPSGHGYLSFVSGAEAHTQAALGIVSLSFSWIMYDFKGVFSDSSDLTPRVVVGSTGYGYGDTSFYSSSEESEEFSD